MRFVYLAKETWLVQEYVEYTDMKFTMLEALIEMKRALSTAICLELHRICTSKITSEDMSVGCTNDLQALMVILVQLGTLGTALARTTSCPVDAATLVVMGDGAGASANLSIRSISTSASARRGCPDCGESGRHR